MGRRSSRQMSNDEFYIATEGMSINDKLKLATYMYLVEKKTLSEIAEISGHKLQSIQRKSRDIWAKHVANTEALPDGWVKDEVALPYEEMKKIQRYSNELLLSIKEKNKL